MRIGNGSLPTSMQNSEGRKCERDIMNRYKNILYFSNDKITMQTSAIHFVAATQNWVMKVSNYKVNFAHQSDTALIAVKVR